MTTITCNVHTDAETRITCEPLRKPYCGCNTVNIDSLTIFADEAKLRQLADAINARLAAIEAEAVQVAA
jgi:hypothetical protein